MATETWYGPNVSEKRYYGYGRPCGTPYKNKYFYWAPKYQYVTSYRGKPQDIVIMGKNRKRFHAFTRYRREITSPQVGYTCTTSPGTVRNAWGEDYMAYHFWFKTPKYPLTTAVYYREDPCPFVQEVSIYNYGVELRDFVIRDLYAKANAPIWDGAVFVAELNETLVELKRILLGVSDSLFKMTHVVKKRTAKERLSRIHPEEWWLWFRYFLMPAMMDAEDIIAATKGVRRIDRVQDGDRSDGIEKTSGTGFLIGAACGDWHANWRAECRYGLGGAIDMYKRFDPHPYGFSEWDVLRATWERIPWSFVVDWFINVGDWLASLREIEIDYAQSYATFCMETKVYVDFPEWVMTPTTVCYDSLLISRITDLDVPTLPLVDKNWGRTLRYIDSISLIVGMLRNILSKRR